MMVRLGPGNIVLAPATERGTVVPHFSAHVYVVAKRSPISATAEPLF